MEYFEEDLQFSISQSVYKLSCKSRVCTSEYWHSFSAHAFHRSTIAHPSRIQSGRRTMVLEPAVYHAGLTIYSSDIPNIQIRVTSHSVESNITIQLFSLRESRLPTRIGLGALRSCNTTIPLWLPFSMQIIYKLQYRVAPELIIA
jgi:hypothetical protein